jgi:uncharacterized repeat protein (TIGR01451 family)
MKRTVQLQLRGRGAAALSFQATATADRGLTVNGDVVKTTFQGFAALKPSIDAVNLLAVGEQKSYLITVRNTGTADATGVVVVATLSPELAAAAEPKGPTRATQEAGKIAFEATTIRMGEEARYEIFVKGMKAGDARLRMELLADCLKEGGAVRQEASTTVFEEAPGKPGEK